MKTYNGFLNKSTAKVYLLYLLKALNEISEKYNIPIYASGGTCLGMVRHKGMIPWDDDIDMMIFRKDYARFVKACEDHLKPPVVLRTREKDPYFYQEFAKLCFLCDDGSYSELSIDIFELDETDPDRKVFRAFQNTIKRWLYYTKQYKVARLKEGEDYHPDSLIKRFFLRLSGILPLKTMDKLLLSVLTAEKKRGDYLVNWGAAYSYKKATYPKTAFGTPRKMEFENTYVWAEQYPEIILKQLYGNNYMELPPVEKRTDHGVKEFQCSAIDYDEIKKEVGL